MKINELPSLRVLLILLISYGVFSYWNGVGVLFGLLLLFIPIFSKAINWKSIALMLLVVVLCFIRFGLDERKSYPEYVFRVQKILKSNKNEVSFIAEGNSKVIFYGNSKFGDLVEVYPYDIIQYNHAFNSLPVPKSLDGFIYNDYLKSQCIDSVAYLNSRLKLLSRDSCSFTFISTKFKQKIIDFFLSFNSVEMSTKGFVIALLTGDKSYLSYEQKQIFRDAGVVHVLAISGLHVGVFYLTLSFLFTNVCRLSAKVSLVPIIFLLLAYALLTGFTPSVLRATIMFTLIQLGKSFQQNTNTLNIVFGSATLMLFYTPSLINDIGFQLSYSAVIGIVLMTQNSRLSSVKCNKFIQPIFSLFLVNIAAFCFTVPLLVYHFGVINFTSLWSSLVIVPLISLAMYTGVGIIVFSFSEVITVFLLLMFEYLLELINKILAFFLNYFQFEVPFHLNLFEVFTVLFFVSFFLIGKRLLLIISIVCVFISFFEREPLELRFLRSDEVFEIKIGADIIVLNSNEKIIKDELVITSDSLNVLSVKILEVDTNIDFNVNKYHYLLLEF